MRWRSIKSAPKDRLVLLSCNEHPEYPPYVCAGRWIEVPHSNEVHWLLTGDHRISADLKTLDDLTKQAQRDAHWCDGYPAIMRGGDGTRSWESWEMRGGILFRPTHWMPMPESPRFKKPAKRA